MAGSIIHCLEEGEEKDTYCGTNNLENMGDMKEAVDEMMFVILGFRQSWGGQTIIDHLTDQYYRCLRGEEPWPRYMGDMPKND